MIQPPLSWTLPETIRRRFGQERPGKQRAMFADGHLLLVLHKLPQPGTQDRAAVYFWRKPNGEWMYSEWGTGLEMLRKHVGAFDLAEDRLSAAYAGAQDAAGYFQVLQQVSPVLHAAKNLHVTLQAAREAIPEDRDIIDLRDWAYEVERTLDLLHTDAKTALDFHVARKTEEQAQLDAQALQTAHRLNVLAAIFFPLTAIASIFGMNMQSGLEHAEIWVFWAIFLAGILTGFFVRQWALGSSRGRKKIAKAASRK